MAAGRSAAPRTASRRYGLPTEFDADATLTIVAADGFGFHGLRGSTNAA
jgi:hypothetical protein